MTTGDELFWQKPLVAAAMDATEALAELRVKLAEAEKDVAFWKARTEFAEAKLIEFGEIRLTSTVTKGKP